MQVKTIKLNINKSNGSTLLLALIIILIITSYLVESSDSIWQFKKTKIFEKKRQKLSIENKKILNLISNKLKDRTSIDSLTNEINFINESYNMNLRLIKDAEANNYKYRIYLVVINSIIDFTVLDAYHETRYIYVCVYENRNHGSQQCENQDNMLGFFPISDIATN